jgi:hypothetical protein
LSFGAIAFSFFCKGKSWYVAKSKEIITMELQNELEVATFAGDVLVYRSGIF